MKDYLIGLGTLPVLALVVFGGRHIAASLGGWWSNYGPGFNQDDNNAHWRASVAAAVVLARRFFMLRLPGGLVIAYRSTGPKTEAHGASAAQRDMRKLSYRIYDAARHLADGTEADR